MSREIKFRAWDNKGKCWYPAETMKDFFNYLSEKFAIIADWFNKDVISLEQYTGLKDKNGKEIYEGDIVKCILGNKPIVFHDCRHWLGETLDDLFVANLRYDIEVIGTIHENPELLGGEE